MTSKRASDLFGADDLPTTAQDVRALRENRPRQPQPGIDWLEELTVLASQVPQAASDLRRRRTFAAVTPFEL